MEQKPVVLIVDADRAMRRLLRAALQDLSLIHI